MFKNLNPWSLGISGHQSEIIELALTYGFRGIDVDIVEIARRARKKGMPYAKRLIASARMRTGFRVGSFTLPCDLEVSDAVFAAELETLAHYAEVAEEIGCTRCVVRLAPAGDQRPYHENVEFHRHRFAEICKVFQPRGIWLGVGFRASRPLREGHAFQFVHDLSGLQMLVNIAEVPNIGIWLDLWDLHVSGGSVEDIQQLRPEQVVAVQVADLPEEVALEEVTEAERLLPMATGRVDCAGMLVALSQMGFGGPVTPAPAKGTLQATRRDPIVRETSAAMDKLWEAAGLSPQTRRSAVASGN